MIRWLYNLFFPVAFLLMLPGYLRRMMRRGNYRKHFGQRFGFYSPEVRARLSAGPARPWLQAVSVGEMLVALKLIAALREQHPDLPLVLSTTTTTGYTLAVERVPAGVEVIYTPIDLRGAVRRALRVLRPSQLIIVDGGLWPNQLWEARRRGVQTALVNARLSPRSERRFRRFRRLAAPMFASLDLVAVPEASDCERWQSLGVSRENVHQTGSIKFDDANAPQSGREAAPAAGTGRLRGLLDAVGVSPGSPVLLAGSTHSGEERILAEVYARLRRQFTDLFLIVVPRHVERAREVRADLETAGLRVINRTALTPTPADSQRTPGRADALLVDTTGELRDWYSVSTLVFIGKSLAGIGGQNPAEAVAAGKPVLFGPHMENFADLVSALLAAGGAVQVPDADGLRAACEQLLKDPAKTRRMSEAAQRQLEAHRGAAARTAALLLGQTENPLASEGNRSDIRRPAA